MSIRLILSAEADGRFSVQNTGTNSRGLNGRSSRGCAAAFRRSAAAHRLKRVSRSLGRGPASHLARRLTSATFAISVRTNEARCSTAEPRRPSVSASSSCTSSTTVMCWLRVPRPSPAPAARHGLRRSLGWASVRGMFLERSRWRTTRARGRPGRSARRASQARARPAVRVAGAAPRRSPRASRQGGATSR